MKRKFAFIGSGSFVFTRQLVRDILTYDAFTDAEFALMDINAERREFSRRCVEKIVDAAGVPATITVTSDRKQALEGADGVLITILAGGVVVWRHDIEIPKAYGVDVNVGDTRGPSGIFRFLRTVPEMLEIAKDINDLCPQAVVLNYTNPMAMLCRAVQDVYPELNFTGLCHSVQGTAEMLASWLGAPKEEFTYLCSGINHQAWYLELKWNGEDMYPRLRQLVTEDHEIYNREQVRNEMFLHLDYYVTESSGHNSEYNAWFRKRPDLIEKYCTHGTNWNPGEHAYILKHYLAREDSWREEAQEWIANAEVDLNRGDEYAASIFNAAFGDHTPYRFNGNVRNWGWVPNLPEGCCVEVPVEATAAGIQPVQTPPLPDHIAIFNNVSARIEDLVVKASLTGDRRAVFQAVCMDPLTSAVLSLEEIKRMTDQMFATFDGYLPQFAKK